MIQIIKVTYNDDSDGSMDMGVMVCSSVEKAEKIILNNLNAEFLATWKSLFAAANELNMELTNCIWDDDEKLFLWYDNGKGNTYKIVNIDENKVDTEFQDI